MYICIFLHNSCQHIRLLLFTGSVVGRLNLDHPSEVKELSVSQGNPYLDLDLVLDTDGIKASFTVTKRIDIDRGLNRIQHMYIQCIRVDRLQLEVGMRALVVSWVLGSQNGCHL